MRLTLKALLRRLRRDERGVSFVEFAFGAPVFVLMMMGGLEYTSLALTHMRLSRTAETLADNVSRITIQVDETDLDQIFRGVSLQGSAISLDARGRVIVSSIEDNGQTGSNKGQTIRWQRCNGAKTTKVSRYGAQGKGKTNADLATGVGPAGRQITAQFGTAVILAEVVYDYQPILFSGIIPNQEIRYESAFNVRERDQLGITNSKPITAKTC